MTIKDKILVIEDEQNISNFISAILTANGYDVLVARNGTIAETMIASHCPDIIILDLGLPDMDGMQILRRVRAWSKIPIVVVSARSHEQDKVAALDAGADDYLTKPFGTEELLARIRAAVRHTRTPIGSESVANTGIFKAGDLTIDYAKHRVFVAGRDAMLTQNEYKLVSLLGLHAGKVLTYDYLIRELWGPSAKSDNQILRVNMANIRRKIERNPAQPMYIFTEVGVGSERSGGHSKSSSSYLFCIQKLCYTILNRRNGRAFTPLCCKKRVYGTPQLEQKQHPHFSFGLRLYAFSHQSRRHH